MLWVLLAAFVFLMWQRFHPYIVTREEMRMALERVLEKKMTEDDWRRLVDRPISRDRYLDTLRQRLSDLPRLPQKEDGALFRPPEMAKISTLLDELQKKTAEPGARANAHHWSFFSRHFPARSRILSSG